MKTVDVVCGMRLDEPSDEWFITEYEGRKYYFCTQLCKVQFESDPRKYSSEEWHNFLEERERGKKD